MKKFSYTVLFTRSKQAPKDADPLEAYTSFVAASIQSIAADLQRTKTEVIQKNGTILRGGLTEFLSTPLKSDKDSIIKLIQDSIENSIRQLDAAPMLSTVDHTLWSIIDPQDVPLHRHSVGLVKRLLKQGKNMLTLAGSPGGKNAEPVMLSQFQFEGFSTMLPLKKIIDQFGDEPQLDQVNNVMHTRCDSSDFSPRTDLQRLIIELDVNDPSLVVSHEQELRNAIEGAGASQMICAVQTFRSTVGASMQLSCSLEMSAVPVGAVISAIADVHQDLKTALNNHASLYLLQPRP